MSVNYIESTLDVKHANSEQVLEQHLPIKFKILNEQTNEDIKKQNNICMILWK